MPANIQNPWQEWNIDPAPIGKGSFGQVYRITRNDEFGVSEEAAMKVLNIPADESKVEEMRSEGMDDASITTEFHDQVRDIVNEYKLMKELRSCQNIVHCDDYKVLRKADGLRYQVYIRMELLTPLTKIYGEVATDAEVIQLGIDLCNALEVCRKRGVLHRDIKPQNIFRDENGVYKLGDFGIARVVQTDGSVTSNIGTLNYMAPEVHSYQHYGHTADIYSLGLVMYFLLNELRQPFLPLPPATITYTDRETARMRRFGGETIPGPKNGSAGLKAVILKACSFNPKDRYQTAKEFAAALNAIEESTVYEDEKPGTEQKDMIIWDDSVGHRFRTTNRQREVAMAVMLRLICEQRVSQLEYTPHVAREVQDITTGKRPEITDEILLTWRQAGIRFLKENPGVLNKIGKPNGNGLMVYTDDAGTDYICFANEDAIMQPLMLRDLALKKSDKALWSVALETECKRIAAGLEPRITQIQLEQWRKEGLKRREELHRAEMKDDNGKDLSTVERQRQIARAIMLRNIAQYRTDRQVYSEDVEEEAWTIFLGKYPMIDDKALQKWRSAGLQRLEDMKEPVQFDDNLTQDDLPGYKMVHMSDPKLGTVSGYVTSPVGPPRKTYDTFIPGYTYTDDPFYLENKSRHQIWQDSKGHNYRGSETLVYIMEAIMLRNISERKATGLIYNYEVELEALQIYLDYNKPIGDKPVLLWEEPETIRDKLKNWRLSGYRRIEILMAIKHEVIFRYVGEESVDPAKARQEQEKNRRFLENIPEDIGGYDYIGENWDPLADDKKEPPVNDSIITRKDADGNFYAGTENDVLWKEAIMYRNILDGKVDRLLYTQEVDQEFQQFKAGVKKFSALDCIKWIENGRMALKEGRTIVNPDGKAEVPPKVLSDPGWMDEDGKLHFGLPPKDWIQMENGRWRAPVSDVSRDSQITRKDANGRVYTGTEAEITVLEAIMYRHIAEGKMGRLFYSEAVEKEYKLYQSGARKFTLQELANWTEAGKKKLEENKKWFAEADSDPHWRDANGALRQGFPPSDWILMENGRWRAPDNKKPEKTEPQLTRRDDAGNRYTGTQYEIAAIEAIMYRNIAQGKANKLLYTNAVKQEYELIKSGKKKVEPAEVIRWVDEGKRALERIKVQEARAKEPIQTRRDADGNAYCGTAGELAFLEGVMYRNIAEGKADRLRYTEKVHKELERFNQGELKVSAREFDRWLTDGKNALKKIEEAKKAPVITRKDFAGREYSGTADDIALIEAIMYRNISQGKAKKLLFTADVQNEFQRYKTGKAVLNQSDIAEWTRNGKMKLMLLEDVETHVDPVDPDRNFVRNPFLRFLRKYGILIILGLLIWGIVSFVTGKDKTEVQSKKPDAPAVTAEMALDVPAVQAEAIPETTACSHQFNLTTAVGKGELLATCNDCGYQQFLKADTALVDLPKLSDSNPAGTTKDVDMGTFATSNGTHWGKALKFWVINKEGYTNSEYVEFDLDGEHTTLVLYAACGKDSQDGGFMDLAVYGDGSSLRTVRNISKVFEHQTILDVTGINNLRLECSTESSVNCHCLVQAYLGNFEI